MSRDAGIAPFRIEGRVVEGDEASAIIQGMPAPFQLVIQSRNLVPVEIYYGRKAEQFGRKIQYAGSDPMAIYWIGYQHRNAILESRDVYMTWFGQGEWQSVEEELQTEMLIT